MSAYTYFILTLQDETYLFYIMTQGVPQSKHSVSRLYIAVIYLGASGWLHRTNCNITRLHSFLATVEDPRAEHSAAFSCLPSTNCWWLMMMNIWRFDAIIPQELRGLLLPILDAFHFGILEHTLRSVDLLMNDTAVYHTHAILGPFDDRMMQ